MRYQVQVIIVDVPATARIFEDAGLLPEEQEDKRPGKAWKAEIAGEYTTEYGAETLLRKLIEIAAIINDE